MLLVIGSDDALLEGLAQSLAANGQRVATCQSLDEAAQIAEREPPLLLLVDRTLLGPGTEASLRLARRAQEAPQDVPQGIVVPYVDLHVFADELASYGPEVRVVEPADLRAEVIRRLEATVVLHGGAA